MDLWNHNSMISIYPEINAENVWALQDKGYQLGDSILWTPILRQLSLMIQRPVPVFFETAFLQDIFLDCPFMKILQERPSHPPFITNRIGYIHTMLRTDTNAYQVVLASLFGAGIEYVPYIDRPATVHLQRDHRRVVAVLHGCLSENRLKAKGLSQHLRNDIIQSIIDVNMRPLVFGTDADRERYWQGIDCDNTFGMNLRDAVSLLNQCDAFVGNDTGLSHAAQALGLQGIVLFRESSIYQTPSSRIRVVRDSEYMMLRAVKEFLTQVSKNPLGRTP